MDYTRPTSFSQTELFYTCPRTWYMKYVQKIPGIEDLKYAHRGNVVHYCLENYYPDKTMTMDEVKDLFEKEWKKFKLDETSLKNNKNETWEMIVRGIEMNLHVTSTELKIFYPDVVAYIDVLNTKEGIISDWKTSTRAHYNEKSYMMQVKYYAWLYYRKFGKLPTEANVKYLKYIGDKAELGCKPTMEDIKNAEKWHNEARRRMNYYVRNPSKLPPFNQNYFFCPYKHLWNLGDKTPDDMMKFIIDVYGNFFYIKGDLDNFIKNHLDKKYSYELKNAYFIQKAKPNANTMVRFFMKSKNRLPIGFLEETLKSLHQYAEFRKKIPVITMNDRRYLDNTILDMPDSLLSGKILRPYQIDAVDTYVNRNKVGFLQLITGSGKTLIAAEIIRRLRCKTLFVVDKKELLYQAKETFKQELGIEVGVIGDGKKEIKDVTVATIQTLTKNLTEYQEYLNEVRFLICDEAHKIASKSYYKLGSYMRNTEYRLSLTATAYRDDGNDMMLTAMGGPIVYSLTGQDLIEKGYLMKPKINFIKVNNTGVELMEMETASLKGLINETPEYLLYYPNFIVRNERRNKIIQDICNKYSDKSVLVLVKLIEHGELLESMIPGSKYIYGETPGKIRTKMLQDFKKGKLNFLISTISIFAEGVDIPSLDVVVNAAANKGDIKSIQVLGRVLRKKEGKDNARYFDFVDSGDFFYVATQARIKAFREEGHTVTYKEVEDV